MSSEPCYTMCRKCGAFGRADVHQCPPRWEWRETLNYGPDEWEECYAYSAEMAAVKAATEYDEEDHYLLRGTDNYVLIMVRSADNPHEVTVWRCYGETEPRYIARPNE